MTIDTLNAVIRSNPESPGDAIRAYLAGIGKRGGAAGRGEAKMRETSFNSKLGKTAAAARWKGHVKSARGKTTLAAAVLSVAVLWFTVGYGLASGF
jgi:hypothetical protein